MLRTLSIILIFAILYLGGFLYFSAPVVCPVPISYRIGELDERFNLSREAAESAIEDAAAIWETATAQDLFVEGAADADLPIHFLFDDRQIRANAEEQFSGQLETAGDVTESLSGAIRP